MTWLWKILGHQSNFAMIGGIFMDPFGDEHQWLLEDHQLNERCSLVSLKHVNLLPCALPYSRLQEYMQTYALKIGATMWGLFGSERQSRVLPLLDMEGQSLVRTPLKQSPLKQITLIRGGGFMSGTEVCFNTDANATVYGDTECTENAWRVYAQFFFWIHFYSSQTREGLLPQSIFFK